MRVFVTEATGVIGRQAVPRLLQAGHSVTGVARTDVAAGWQRAVGAPPPRRLPGWLARMLHGGTTGLLTVSQRVSNRRFRQAAGWEPRYPSVEAGWPTVATPEDTDPWQVA